MGYCLLADLHHFCLTKGFLKTHSAIGTQSAFCIHQIVPGFVVYYLNVAAAAYDTVWKQWLLRQWQRGDCDPLVAAQTEPVIQPATAGGALLWRAHARLVCWTGS